MKRFGRLLAGITRWAAYAVVFLLGTVLVLLLVIQTGWAKNQIRQLIVSQANRYLNATLEIDRLEGSLLRGVHLSGVTLVQSGAPIIQIDDVSVAYSIRELFTDGTSIRRIELVRPRIVAARNEDGRWNLAALVRREAEQQERKGPRRPLRLVSIEVSDGTVELRDPLTFGAAHLPARFDDLDLDMAFYYEPVSWRMEFAHASWKGSEPEMNVTRMSGAVGSGADAWLYRDLHVETPHGQIDVNGTLDRTVSPSVLHLQARGKPFDFQEWAPVLPVLSRMRVVSGFEATLDGPLAALRTNIDLTSNAGNVRGEVTLDTTIPGWGFSGDLTLARLDLAPWLSHPEQPSDISGRVRFDLTWPRGAHFPQGTYRFNGPHVRFMQYEADDLVAQGHLTPASAVIASATATAYGANVRLDAGSIGIDAPYPFTFVGYADGVDLRRMPPNVPVPHVESVLSFAFDTRGRFSNGFIAGDARFAPSTFLGAAIGDGAVGAIDTSVTPFVYSGEGDLANVDVNAFGQGLDVAWMQDPRYAGVLDGHFHVQGSGSDAATMTLSGGGRLNEGHFFEGVLSNADIGIEIAGGSLSATYSGEIARVNPAIPMDDPRYESRLSGRGTGRIAVRDLLVRTVTLDDYDLEAHLELTSGTDVRGIAVDRGTLGATLRGSALTIGTLEAAGASLDMSASGPLALDDTQSSDIRFDVRRADLHALRDLLGRDLNGQLTTTGTLGGTPSRLRLAGDATVSDLEAKGIHALTASGHYDATIPTDAPAASVLTLDARATFVEAFGQQLQEVSGTVGYASGHATADLSLARSGGLAGTIAGAADIDVDRRHADIGNLTVTIDRSTWTLAAGTTPRIAWDDRGVTVSQLALTDAATAQQRVSFDGSWFPAGGGSVRIVASAVSLDAFFATGNGGPGRFGGSLSADLTLTGSSQLPIVAGTARILNGRIWRTAFQSASARIDFRERVFDVDARLDQSPGIWFTAVGSVPLGAFVRSEPERPVNVKIASSLVDLGLLEGVTNVVTNVSGQFQVNTTVLGTTKDPHFDGAVDVQNGAFRVASSGVRYKNARLALRLSPDRVNVEALHVEDADGHPLDVQGSLATHELRVSDLAVTARARAFEVLRNEYGRIDVDANVSMQGRFESPRLTGRVTITSGELNVDTILDRALFRPYATTPSTIGDMDAVAALNPWELMGLDIELNVPNSLRLVGENVQVTPGTPLGFGNINLRALGDLYLYKDPGQPLYVTGSLDSVTGTYSFQGRRFDLDPSSSINFHGDPDPGLFVTVHREISGVDTRVTIAGSLREPELRLASTPPLDPSDILSLIVFNTSTNQLSSLQQEQLAVRAGTLAAGFLAAPLVGALERSLGLDTLEIEPVSDLGGTGTRVTIGNEIAPGLVARFSRQFGTTEYDEATIEYYLSRLFRIRATFSDATSLAARSPFRRVERAGIDFLVLLSF